MDTVSTNLKAGDRAPDFSVRDWTGTLRTLAGLLAPGPLVLVFYRGHW